MSRSIHKLTAKQVSNLPKGNHGDGGGLLLVKKDKDRGQWVYRYTFLGKAKRMGLGGMHKVTLADVRDLRDECARMVRDGRDPQIERSKAKNKVAQTQNTFSEVAEDAFESKKAGLRGEGKAGRWFSPLRLHVIPKLGKLPITQIDQNDIREALNPIWREKPDTARKAITRIGIVFRHAAALGLEVDVFAPAKAKELLGESGHAPKRIPSMPHDLVSKFYNSVGGDSPTQLALRFLILNPGARSKPVRFLTRDQIQGNVWTVPGSLMKGTGNKVSDWRTPLSHQSLELLRIAEMFETNGYLFPNVTGKGVISDASMSRLMERRKLDYRPHGFRASFRTWAAEAGKSRVIAELCLAHKFYDPVEAAYVRTEQLEDRGSLMQEWSDYVGLPH